MEATQQNNGGLDIMLNPVKREDVHQQKERIIKLLDAFLNRYDRESVKCKDLDDVFQRLRRSRKEFDATRFFVLVVGPVKSGKSTLVNIFARKYVSPTALRECTALPTLIGKAVGAHQNKIVQFFPKLERVDKGLSEEQYRQAVDDRKVRTFNYIIDVLRGVESVDILNNWVTTNTFELNKDKVNEVVALHPDASVDSRELLVSIGVDGDGFIDDEIVLIDMPGLDGRQVNADNMAVYKAMADRADFIFFVQSTTTAINNATNDFLTDLFKDKVKRVPIRLIHNVHDSQYFKPDEITRQSVAEQVSIGRECIQKTFGITNFDSLSINLGMVNSGLLEPEHIKEEYEGMIAQKLEEYRRQEQILMDTLKNERQVIKDKNCVDGAVDTIHYAEQVIQRCIAGISEKEVRIQGNIQRLTDLPSKLNNLQITDAVFLSKFDGLVAQQEVIQNWETAIERIIGDHLPNGGDAIKGVDLKAKMDRIAEECSLAAPTRRGTQFREQLKDAVTDSLTGEPLKGVVREIEEEIEKTEEGTPFHLVLSVENDRLTERPRTFVAKYFDIQEKKWQGLAAKRYSHLEHGNYLSGFKNAMKADLPVKINDYRLSLKADFAQIRDNLINSLKDQLVEHAEQYGEKQNVVLKDLERQKDLLQGMLEDLNWNKDEN